MASIRAATSGRTVNMYQPWYATGIGYFDGVTGQATVKETAPAFGCSSPTTGQYVSGSATITAVMTCQASQGIKSTGITATACLVGGGCASANGTVYFN